MSPAAAAGLFLSSWSSFSSFPWDFRSSLNLMLGVMKQDFLLFVTLSFDDWSAPVPSESFFLRLLNLLVYGFIFNGPDFFFDCLSLGKRFLSVDGACLTLFFFIYLSLFSFKVLAAFFPRVCYTIKLLPEEGVF
jgi:hypothetical protein